MFLTFESGFWGNPTFIIIGKKRSPKKMDLFQINPFQKHTSTQIFALFRPMNHISQFFLKNTGIHDYRSQFTKYAVHFCDFRSLVMIYLILIGDFCSLVIKYEIIIGDFCSPVMSP